MSISSTSQELFDALSHDVAARDLWAITTRYLEARGFDRVIHIAIDDPCGAPQVRTTMPLAFVDTYQAEGFAADDPFLTYCLPFAVSIETGAAYLDQYEYLSERGHALIELAACNGFSAGYSVTTALPSARGAEGWNLGSSHGRREVESQRKHHGSEISFALMALRGRLPTRTPPLSARERQVIDLLIQGNRNKEIAALLDLKEVTVEFHIASAKRKFSAATRDQLIAKYMRHRPAI